MSDRDGFVSEEATGVYDGVLTEDMIQTVIREKRLVCNVDVADVFNSEFRHPLVHVPLWAMSLPLRKGDKVRVLFNQGDPQYPVLYKNPSDLPDGFLKNFDLGKGVSGGNINIPAADDNVACFNLGEDSYLIKTESYTVLHQNGGFVLIDRNDKIYVYGKEINLSADGKLNVDCSQDLTIKSLTGVTVNGHLKVLP